MRYAMLMTLPLVLAGCVGPVTVGDQDNHFVYVPSQGPHRAAQCMVRNTKGRSPALVAEALPARQANVWEVTVSDGTGVLATARADVTAIVVSVHAPQADNEKFANALVGFC